MEPGAAVVSNATVDAQHFAARPQEREREPDALDAPTKFALVVDADGDNSAKSHLEVVCDEFTTRD